MKKWIALFATITLILGIAISLQRVKARTATELKLIAAAAILLDVSNRQAA